MISDEAAEPAETTNFNHTDVKPDTEHDDDAICCVEFLSSFPNVSFFLQIFSIQFHFYFYYYFLAKLANNSNNADDTLTTQALKMEKLVELVFRLWDILFSSQSYQTYRGGLVWYSS